MEDVHITPKTVREKLKVIRMPPLSPIAWVDPMPIVPLSRMSDWLRRLRVV